MSKKPWSEHDKNMLEKLNHLKLGLQVQVDETNYLILKIKQKYEFTERELVINTGRY